MTKLNIEEVRQFIQNSTIESKIYIGTDSSRFKKNGKWFAEYATVVIVHFDGKHGCKIFADLSTEIDFDQKKDKPRNRLMNEVIKTANMYLELEEAIDIRDVELHLDINPNEKYGSSCVIQEAVGYIRGLCRIVPMVKPQAFAASCAADRLCA